VAWAANRFGLLAEQIIQPAALAKIRTLRRAELGLKRGGC
jgi:hypothetical protein